MKRLLFTLLILLLCCSFATAQTGRPVVNGSTAGGDLAGTYPNPSVLDDSHSHGASTLTQTGEFCCGCFEKPVSGDSCLCHRFDTAVTITGLDCLVSASTSAVLTLQECDGNGANCTAVEAAMTCTTTNTTESGGIDNSSIDAGDWIKLVVGTVVGLTADGDHAVMCYSFTRP